MEGNQVYWDENVDGYSDNTTFIQAEVLSWLDF